MFDVGPAEFLVLAIVAVFIFGPDRLPEVARQAARLLRSARTLLTSARAQLSEELGPEFANLDLRDMTPRALVQRHLLDDVEDDETPLRAGHQPLERDEAPPYDIDAT
jgi:sec-independent protein translocase protein TatB